MLTSNSPDRPSANSYWVVPGRFAAGEYPGAWNPVETATRLKTLLDAGIDHFSDLTEPGELLPYFVIAEEQALELGHTVEWERHPIVDASIPRSPEQMAAILDAIDDALGDNKTVYVHCWGRSWQDRHSGWLLARAARTHGRLSPSPDRRVVAGSGKDPLASPFTRNARTTSICPQLG